MEDATSTTEEADARVFQVEDRNAQHPGDSLLGMSCSMDHSVVVELQTPAHCGDLVILPSQSGEYVKAFWSTAVS